MAQGEFISALQLKRQISNEEITQFLNSSENEDVELSDRDFFRLCAYLGGAGEVSVFIEKIEKALNPGLREARRDLSKTLKTYGITFADEDQPR